MELHQLSPLKAQEFKLRLEALVYTFMFNLQNTTDTPKFKARAYNYLP